MVLTVPDVAIIDGPGYHMRSYGEEQRSVRQKALYLSSQRSQRQPDGAGSIAIRNWPVLMLLADGFDRWIRRRITPSMPSSSIARARARRLRA